LLSPASIMCGAMPISAMPVATERRISWITQLDTPERLSSSSLQVLHAGDLKTPSPLRGDFSKRARAVGGNGIIAGGVPDAPNLVVRKDSVARVLVSFIRVRDRIGERQPLPHRPGED